MKNSAFHPGIISCKPKITIILCAIITMILFACSFEKPAAPTFETQINLPLLTETYFMSELVEDEEYILAQQNGDLFFQFEQEIEPFRVKDQLKIDPLSEQLSSGLGNFRIESSGSQQTKISLSEIAPEVAAFDGQQTVVAPFDMSPVEKNLAPFSNFRWAKVDSGFATLKIINQVGFTMGEPINIVLSETGTEKTILSTTINHEIAAGDSEIVQLDLSGKTIPNKMNITLSGHSAGSKGKSILIDARKGLLLAVKIGDCIVSAAAARVPQQIVTQKNKIALDDSMQITQAKIQTGQITLEFSGNLPVAALLIYELADFYSPAGAVLSDSCWLNPDQENFSEIDLAGCRLKPENNSAESQSIRFNWTFKTRDTGDKIVELNHQDSLRAQIDVSELQFEQITGVISAMKIDLVPVKKEIDMPSGLDSLLLAEAELQLTIQSAINFPATLALTMDGVCHSGKVAPLYVNEKIKAAEIQGQPQETQITLDKDNSEIVSFMNALPNEFCIQGHATLGEDQWEGTIHRDDYLEGSVIISTPLALAFPEQQVETNTNQLDLDEDIRDKIENHLLEGILWGHAENHLPIETKLEIMFAQVDSLVYEQPDLVIGPIQVKAGNFSGETGYVEEASQSPIQVTLSAEELNTFQQAPLFAGVKLTLPGTNGQVVKVKLADFISVQLSLKVHVKVSNEESF